MWRKIVVGYAHGENGREALALARALGERVGAQTIVATVLPVFGYFDEIETIAKREHTVKADIQRATAGLPGRFSPRVLTGPSAAGMLYSVVDHEEADLLVLGSTRRGHLRRALLGSTAEHLLHGTPCPVAVAPHGYALPPDGIRTIAVAFDGSEQAEAALAWAADVALSVGARVRVIAVVRPPVEYLPAIGGWPLRVPASGDLLDRLRAEMQHRVDDALDTLPDCIAREGVVLVGAPADAIRENVKDACDLLAVGSRGYGPVRSVLLGSTLRALVRDCGASS